MRRSQSGHPCSHFGDPRAFIHECEDQKRTSMSAPFQILRSTLREIWAAASPSSKTNHRSSRQLRRGIVAFRLSTGCRMTASAPGSQPRIQRRGFRNWSSSTWASATSPDGGFELSPRTARQIARRYRSSFLTARDSGFRCHFRIAPRRGRLPGNSRMSACIIWPRCIQRVVPPPRRVEQTDIEAKPSSNTGTLKLEAGTHARHMERRRSAAHRDGILDGAHTGALSWPREESQIS